MSGRIRIGDHTFDEDADFESDQLQDDAAENRPPEPLETLPGNLCLGGPRRSWPGGLCLDHLRANGKSAVRM